MTMMTKTKIKRGFTVFVMVLVRLVIIAVIFAVGSLIGELFYVNTDWWYADAWKLGAVCAGFQMLHYIKQMVICLDVAIIRCNKKIEEIKNDNE